MWWITGIIALLAIACLIIGLALIFDWWTPSKKETTNENGEKVVEKVPLTKREKWTTAALFSSLIFALISLLIMLNPRVMKKLREKLNKEEAVAE